MFEKKKYLNWLKIQSQIQVFIWNISSVEISDLILIKIPKIVTINNCALYVYVNTRLQAINSHKYQYFMILYAVVLILLYVKYYLVVVNLQ